MLALRPMRYALSCLSTDGAQCSTFNREESGRGGDALLKFGEESGKWKWMSESSPGGERVVRTVL